MTAKNREYTHEEHAEIVRRYVDLVEAQIAGTKLSKAQIARDLIAQFPHRTRGAFDGKFMNLSHAAVANGLLPQLPDGYVKGFKPAPNGAKILKDYLAAELMSRGLWLGWTDTTIEAVAQSMTS